MSEKTLKRLDLLFREVEDIHAQENFYRIKVYIDNLATGGLIGPPGPQGPIGPQGPAGTSSLYSAQAGSLVVTRKANSALVKGDAVYAISTTHVDLATADSVITNAMVFGFALADAAISADVDILILGVLEDPIFSVFTLNSPLFLDVSGGITDIKRTTGYHVMVGKALGSNQIFVDIKDPLVIA